MENIIIWCNQNQGFMTTILSIIGFLVSVIAIITSIHAAKLPFKKKLLLECGSLVFVDHIQSYYCTVVNVGNRAVYITDMGFCFNKNQLINMYKIHESTGVINCNEAKSHEIKSEEFEKAIVNEYTIQNHNHFRIYGFVRDNEGKVYRKYFINSSKVIRNR